MANTGTISIIDHWSTYLTLIGSKKISPTAGKIQNNLTSCVWRTVVPAGIGLKEYKTNSMTDKDKINDTDFEVDADDLEYIDYNFPEIDFSNGGYTINLGPVDQYDPPKQQELFRQYIMSQWLHSSHLADENPQWQVESYIKNKPHLKELSDNNQLETSFPSDDTVEYWFVGHEKDFLVWKLRWSEYLDRSQTFDPDL